MTTTLAPVAAASAARDDAMPPHLRVLRDPDEVNECRCYTADEVAALTGMSASYVKQQARDGHLKRVVFGRRNPDGSPANNARVMYRHPAVVEWLRGLED